MRYLMRQKVWSWTSRFAIKNDRDEDVGFIDGQALAWGHKLSFTDVLGHEVARIEQKLMSWGPTYEIYRDGYLAAVVKKELFRMTPRFSVDVPGPDDLEIEGDVWGHEYFFTRNNQAVATVSKAWWTMADTFGVECLDSVDHILVLACTVVVDLVNHDAHRS
ncbi:MAG: LURP-one-related family protein [Kofleriaceae bacterium]